MPKINTNNLIPYDLKAWRLRCGYSQEMAAIMLGVSTAKISRVEKTGLASRELAWACYGVEVHLTNAKVNTDNS